MERHHHWAFPLDSYHVFAFIFSPNLHKNFALLSLVMGVLDGKGEPESFRNMPRVPQLVSGRAGTHIQPHRTSWPVCVSLFNAAYHFYAFSGTEERRSPPWYENEGVISRQNLSILTLINSDTCQRAIMEDAPHMVLKASRGPAAGARMHSL